MHRSLILPLLLLCSCATVQAPPESLGLWLKSLPGAEVEELKTAAGFQEAFLIRLPQPLDHEDPGAGNFLQRIYLSHRGYDAPVLLETEGYAANRNHTRELSRLLQANQIVVEHRYFGESKPEPVDWEYLTVRQAAEDHHRIAELFKEIYPGKWVASGTSKGGQTALFFRRYFPRDVDVTVPYVAPIPLAQEDPRVDRFLETVGDEETREKIRRFQILLLQRREEILPLVREHAETMNLTFSMGEDAAYEYAVLEYPFSFWQFGRCDKDSIPGKDATAQALFEHFITVVSFRFYSDEGIREFEPFFFQSSTELGYYGFDTDHLQGLLQAVPRPTNTAFAPRGVDLTYCPEVMADIHAWLVEEGDFILYLYGELDTWSACAVEPGPSTNAVKVVNPGGHHALSIQGLPEKERDTVYSTLEKWLDVTIDRGP